ncbi:MAG: hypothetical protein HY722_10320 [Planctomycetes bacterium]|nr:hypothetical protein [Planctomycetota bacterium]
MVPRLRLAWLVVPVLGVCGQALAQEGEGATVPLSAPTGVELIDRPNDDGKALMLLWDVMPYDAEGVVYRVEVAAGEAPFRETASLAWQGGSRFLSSEQKWPFWAWRKDDRRHLHVLTSFQAEEPDAAQAGGSRLVEKSLEPLTRYRVRLTVLRGEDSAWAGPLDAVPVGNLFNRVKLHNLIYTLLFSGIILVYIARARRRELFLRRIPGLDAVEEAIGRGTEMGRPIYFLTGRYDIGEPSTMAAITILGEVAKKVALYDTRLKVPHTYPMVMAVSQEVVKEAYIEAGRPDAFSEEINFFVTDDQFSYAAAVEGMMVRERPAACFYMGYYFAESLLMAETGAETGAIQVAGTDADHQLPFFVTACDYTLIGEELYAASAYLSRKPVLVGTLRGQDAAKAILMAAILAGTALATLGAAAGWSPATLGYVLDAFRDFGG